MDEPYDFSAEDDGDRLLFLLDCRCRHCGSFGTRIGPGPTLACMACRSFSFPGVETYRKKVRT